MDRVGFDPQAMILESATGRASELVAPRAGPTAAARPWRCHACGSLLGVERDGDLHVKYKEAQYWIRGHCRHACRRCRAMNSFLAPAFSVASSSPLLKGDRE